MNRTVERVKFNQSKQYKFTRVAAYARVSVEKDAALHSLSNQISYYSSYIQSHEGWIYCGVYTDEALSGTKEDRDEFNQLIEDCKAGRIDMIITKSLSRFARNVALVLQTIRDLKSIGVDIYFEEENIHTISAVGELMISIIASFDQANSEMNSELSKQAFLRSARNGEIVNLRRIFGYDIDKTTVTINKAEAEIVKEIYSRIIIGDSLSSIARDFNNRGVKRPYDGIWTPERVKSLARNEKYKGDFLYQKTFRNNYIEKKKVENRGELPMYYAEETHPPIIDDEIFDLANKVLDGIVPSQKMKKSEHEFTSMILCPFCGKHYRRIRSPHTGEYKWNCKTYVSRGLKYCHGKAIPEDVLIELSMDILGIKNLTREALTANIKQIIVPDDNKLVFELIDGTKIYREWQGSRNSPRKKAKK